MKRQIPLCLHEATIVCAVLFQGLIWIKPAACLLRLCRESIILQTWRYWQILTTPLESNQHTRSERGLDYLYENILWYMLFIPNIKKKIYIPRKRYFSMVIDQVVQGGVGVTFEGVKKNNCCMLITKKLGI